MTVYYGFHTSNQNSENTCTEICPLITPYLDSPKTSAHAKFEDNLS